MRRTWRLGRIITNDFSGLESRYGLDEDAIRPCLSGYVADDLSSLGPTGKDKACGYVVIMTGAIDDPELGIVVPSQPQRRGAYFHRPNGSNPPKLQLRPIGRLIPIAATQSTPEAAHTLHTLRSVRSGQDFCITSPSAHGLVTPELAETLETIFHRFAREREFTSDRPLEIQLTRGFKSGSHGHCEGRAADISAVGGKTLLEWKQEWDSAMADAEKLPESQQKAEAFTAEQKRNLGYALYKALQEHSGWRVNRNGWRPYQNVVQLFGPWTATEGPWKTMHIKNPTLYQQQRLADQHWVFKAHQDHVHVAK